MNLFRNLLDGLRALFNQPRADREMDEELGAFLDASARDKSRAGLSPAAARRAALVEMGSAEAVKDNIRDAGWESAVGSFVQDVRYAARIFAKNPAFTATAVLTLALGIGANTAIFSLMDAVLLRFLPVEKPEQLVQIGMRHPKWGDDVGQSFTNPLWEQLRDRQDVLSGVFAWSEDDFDLAQGGPVQPVKGLWVSGGFFSTLGLRPAAGRMIAPSDDQRGCPGVAVLSYGYWQSRYEGARGAIGTTISLDRHTFPIIGVAPAGFFGMDVGQAFDVAIPICAAAIFDAGRPMFASDPGIKSRLDHRSWWWLKVAGRAKPGISSALLDQRLRALSPPIFSAAVPAYWSSKQQQGLLERWFVATPGGTGSSELRGEFRQPLYVLMGVVGLVLLIACANLATLMLARAASRGKEIAVRRALGASRMRLVRQLLTECVMLSLSGALLGLLFARWGAALLVRQLSVQQNPVFLDLSLDPRVLGFTVAVAVLTALLFGVLPAFRSTSVSLAGSMKGAGAVDANAPVRIRAGTAAVVVQVALSLALLVASGLFLRSFRNLVTEDLGFERVNVLIVRANLQTAGVPPDQQPQLFDGIEERLRALPGVLSAARSVITPVGGMTWNQNIQSDAPGAPGGDEALAYFNFVSPGFMQTLRTPMIAGRDFNGRDTATSPQVAIINQTLARKFFPGLNPLGRTFRVMGRGEKLGAPVEVVGVVKDAKYQTLREEPLATAYFPLTQMPERAGQSFEMRTAVPPASLTAEVRDAVAAVNKDISLEFHTLAQQVDDSLVQERLLALLSSFFGALALLLAMIGLYGALSYTVSQRQKEFGVRMALGARPGSILALVVRDVARIVAAGVVAGMGISLVATRVLQKLLFEVSPRDAFTLAAAATLLSCVALLAGYLPARRATRVDPLVVLRTE